MAGGRKRKEAEQLPKEFHHLFVNSPIDGALYRRIMGLNFGDNRPKCLVLSLVTLGGYPNDAYRIGRYLQMMFSEIYIHVPTVCASAGTLLVCAANRLIISPMSERGPLDPQIVKPDEIGARRSGLVTRSLFENLGNHAFELHTGLVEKIIEHSGYAIRYRTAAAVAGEMVVGLMHGMYEQLNPDQIGEDYRFLKVAEEYGKRLAKKSDNITDDSLRELVYGFPSHDFIIDFREAVRLFERVEIPSETLQGLLNDDEAMPLSPAEPRERVVISSVVKGCPIRVEKRDVPIAERPVASTSQSGGEGGATTAGVAEGSESQPRPNGPDADGGNRKRGSPKGKEDGPPREN